MTSVPLQAISALTENLAGLVERVTFHDGENGFYVLRLKARGQRRRWSKLERLPAAHI